MHKSVIILLGLLVVFLPFGSSNIISNANAIASEDEYYNEQNERYANEDYYGLDRSYGYDNDYKSKDKERNIVSISNINCNTVNYNFNNNVIGNFSNGNSGIGGSVANDGTNGALNANANGNNAGYSDGYQKGKDITCISNINNNNTIITTDNGNATNNGNATTLPCQDCFIDILLDVPGALPDLLEILSNTPYVDLKGLCEFLSDPEQPNEVKILILFGQILTQLNIPQEDFEELRDCVIELGLIEPPPGFPNSISTTGSGLTTSGSAGELSNLPTAPSMGLP